MVQLKPGDTVVVAPVVDHNDFVALACKTDGFFQRRQALFQQVATIPVQDHNGTELPGRCLKTNVPPGRGLE